VHRYNGRNGLGSRRIHREERMAAERKEYLRQQRKQKPAPEGD